MPQPELPPTLHVTVSGDVFLKSRRTQRRLIRRLLANLRIALAASGYTGPIERVGSHRFSLAPSPDQLPTVAAAASTVFGIAAARTVAELPHTSIDDLAQEIARRSSDGVHGRSFAVRAKRRGNHDWTSVDLARAAGALLVGAGGTVDLTSPSVEVEVTVLDDRAFLVVDQVDGPGGLPIGTQDRVLCLISGGFDSVVAAWMLMSRGCEVDFVHFSLNCAQSDHAMAVARELWSRWGHGMEPNVHLVEFQPVKDALFTHVDARMRQITLKVMMATAAERIAEDEGIEALVTGDAMGQVSSQTLPHLVAVSRAIDTPVFRPLLGLPKEAIIDLSRRIGTAELSARAQEVCDLSEGRPVATASSTSAVDASVDALPESVLDDVLTTAKTFALRDWSPGQF